MYGLVLMVTFSFNILIVLTFRQDIILLSLDTTETDNLSIIFQEMCQS